MGLVVETLISSSNEESKLFNNISESELNDFNKDDDMYNLCNLETDNLSDGDDNNDGIESISNVLNGIVEN